MVGGSGARNTFHEFRDPLGSGLTDGSGITHLTSVDRDEQRPKATKPSVPLRSIVAGSVFYARFLRMPSKGIDFALPNMVSAYNDGSKKRP